MYIAIKKPFVWIRKEKLKRYCENEVFLQIISKDSYKLFDCNYFRIFN